MRTAFLGAVVHGLAAAVLPGAAAGGELGVPGRPSLVEPEGVRVEGYLRAEEGGSAAPNLVLVATDGRVYEIVGEETARMLEPHVGERLAVEGSVHAVPDGRDELVVRSIRVGGW